MVVNRKGEIMGIFKRKKYPDVKDRTKVGTYDAYTYSGGGYFYDDVLEYRVWVHPREGEVYYQAFPSHKDAELFRKKTYGAEAPLALVRQEEHINEPEDDKFEHIKKPRITEWQLGWLEGSHDTKKQIPIFLEKHRRPER
jgi:putative acetyltransferase